MMDAGGMGTAGVGGGSGCRGPDKICPGRGVGTGRAGTGPVRNGGCSGAAPPAPIGGLRGAGLLRGGSSIGLTAGLAGELAAGLAGALGDGLTGVVTRASWAGPAVNTGAGASNSGTGLLAVCV